MCGCNKVAEAVGNLGKAILKTPNKITWFQDGITGLIKCVGEVSQYTDEQIKNNRDICSQCPHATAKKDGRITTTSQCMAPDPKKNNAPCGCFLVCKTQTDSCPLGKFTNLTISV